MGKGAAVPFLTLEPEGHTVRPGQLQGEMQRLPESLRVQLSPWESAAGPLELDHHLCLLVNALEGLGWGRHVSLGKTQDSILNPSLQMFPSDLNPFPSGKN